MEEQDLLVSENPSVRHSRRSLLKSKKFWLLFAGLILAAGLAVLFIVLASTVWEPSDQYAWANQIRADNIVNHLKQLQEIAFTIGNGTRAVGTPGFNASADYVIEKLKGAGYDPQVQYFSVPNWKVLGTPTLAVTSPLSLSLLYDNDFGLVIYSLGSAVTGKLFSANTGCNVTDYEGHNNEIAMIVTSTECTTLHAIETAVKSNVSGLIISTTKNTAKTPLRVRIDWKKEVPIPLLTTSFSFGNVLRELLATGNDVNLALNASTSMKYDVTYNIWADTKTGRDNRVIVVGSHLDSVPAGPGINDNGSGSSSNLEVALTLANLKLELKNKVRFAWWAAEELGLLGSDYYVTNLKNHNQDEFKKIACNLNFDMLGSPNFFRGVFNGSAGDPSIAVGSGTIQSLWERYFQDNKIAYSLTEFNGRSDYGPFIGAGIPAGGLKTGAEVIKSIEERDKFGGFAGAPYDPCYHMACDTLANVNQQVLGELAKSIGYVLQKLATNEALLDSIATNTPYKE
jgi:Zn-dependent M28 family amino/carboxypeptidase